MKSKLKHHKIRLKENPHQGPRESSFIMRLSACLLLAAMNVQAQNEESLLLDQAVIEAKTLRDCHREKGSESVVLLASGIALASGGSIVFYSGHQLLKSVAPKVLADLKALTVEPGYLSIVEDINKREVITRQIMEVEGRLENAINHVKDFEKVHPLHYKMIIAQGGSTQTSLEVFADGLEDLSKSLKEIDVGKDPIGDRSKVTLRGQDASSTMKTLSSYQTRLGEIRAIVASQLEALTEAERVPAYNQARPVYTLLKDLSKRQNRTQVVARRLQGTGAVFVVAGALAASYVLTHEDEENDSYTGGISSCFGNTLEDLNDQEIRACLNATANKLKEEGIASSMAAVLFATKEMRLLACQ